METFPGTGRAVLLGDRPQSLLDCPLSVEAPLVHQALQPLSAKEPFDLAEDSFNGVELVTVTYVEDGFYVEALVERPHHLCLVDLQLIHEEGHRLLTHFLSESLEKLDEYLCVDGGGT